jgi:hypothetical protein
MNTDNLSNKQSLSLGHHTRRSTQPDHQDRKLRIRKVDHEVWSIECTIEELELNLSRVVENIDSDQGQEMKTLTVYKYYQQAKDLAKWIPIARPVPEFIINAQDLSPDIITELESRLADLPTLSYILKQAVGRIFEN